MQTFSTIRGVSATASALLGFSLACHGFEAKDIMAFRAGPVLLRPHLTVAEQYNDNLFYQSGGPQIDDFITMVTPALDLQIGRSGTALDLGVGYSYTQLFYTQNPYVSDASEHRGTIAGTLSGERLRFSLTGSASYSDTIYGGYESFEFGGLTFLVRAPNVERFNYAFSSGLDYSLSPKTSLHGGLNLSGLDFLEHSRFYDVNSWRGTVGGSYKIRPKISTIVDFYYGQSAAEPNKPLLGPKAAKPPHLETFGAFVGARGEITPNISGTLKVGYQQNYYGDRDFGDPVYQGDLSWKISEKSQLGLNYSRASSASAQSAAAYTRDNVGLQFQQVIGTRRPWIVSLGATYSHNEYQGEGLSRDGGADYYSANMGVFYQVKMWLKTGVGYQYTKTVSDSQSFVDYEINQVTVSVSIGY
jgi:hypothetical protein